MKQFISVVLGLVITSSVASAAVCTVQWNDSGSWERRQSVSSYQACIDIANSVGQDHCAEVASGAPAEDPGGVLLHVSYVDYTSDFAYPNQDIYYSCN
jgi:hypothetical protein